MIRKDFNFACPLRVRYAEVDAQGIVFNAHYLTYFDVAVTEFIRARGLSYEEFQRRYGLDFHVIRSEINYKSPARFDDEIDVCVRGAFRGPRVFWELAIFRGDELLCTGELMYATVDETTRRVKKIDPSVAEFLEMRKRE